MAKKAFAQFLFTSFLVLVVHVARAQSSTITTVAGGGFYSPFPSLGSSTTPATAYSIGAVSAIASDAAGNLYIADQTHNAVYRRDVSSGALTVAAGNGTVGNYPVLQNPVSLAADPAGNLFIADAGADVVYEVSNKAAQVVAGCGNKNNSACKKLTNFGDGEAATAEFIGEITSIAIDSNDNLYISDANTCTIGMVNLSSNPASQTLKSVAGSTCNNTGSPIGGPPGVKATGVVLDSPGAIALDSKGNLFISNGRQVLEVCGPPAASNLCGTQGNLFAVAGGGSESVTNSNPGDQFSASGVALNPVSIAPDDNGNLYIADAINHFIIFLNLGSSPTSTFVAETFSPNETVPQGYAAVIYANTCSLQYCLEHPQDGHLANTDRISYNTNGPFNGPVLFVADSSSSQVAEIDILNTNGLNEDGGYFNFTPVAGNGSNDALPVGVAPTSFQLASPQAVSEDAYSNIYVGEATARIFESVAPSAANPTLQETQIKTLAGTGTAGLASAYPIPAALEQIPSPTALFVDSLGNIDFAGGGLTEEILQSSNLLSTVTAAGNNPYNVLTGNSSDNLYTSPSQVPPNLIPQALCADQSGNIYTAYDRTGSGSSPSSADYVLWLVNTAGQGAVIAGGGLSLPQDPNNHWDLEDVGDNGPATSAIIDPQGCFVDGVGNVYIADGWNDRVRKVDVATGTITTIAGSQFPGFSGDNQTPLSANKVSLSFPNAVWGDQLGNLLISDSGNNRIREIVNILPVPSAHVTCTSCSLTTQANIATITLANMGDAPLILNAMPSLTDSDNFSITSNCPIGPPGVPVNAVCTSSVTAKPIATNATTAVMFSDNAYSSNTNATTNPPGPTVDQKHVGQWAGYVQTSDQITYSAPGPPVASLDPLTLQFTAVNLPQAIKLTNTGQSGLNIKDLAVSLPYIFEPSPPADSCSKGASLKPNASCNIYVEFPAPTSGTSSAQTSSSLPVVTITDNATLEDSGVQAIPLLGYALVPMGGASFSISNKSPAPVQAQFQLVNIPSSAMVTPECSVTPAGLDVSCSYSSTNQTITATVSIPSCVSTQTSKLLAPSGGPSYWKFGMVGFALLLPWGSTKRRRNASTFRRILLLCYVVGGLSSCANTSKIGSQCVASVAPTSPMNPFKLKVTANPVAASSTTQYPSLTLTTPDTISVTQ